MSAAHIARVRIAGVSTLGVSSAVLLACLGCGDAEISTTRDAGADFAFDALAPSLSLDGAVGGGVDGGPELEGEGDDRDSLGNAATCFDGIDQDRDERLDCDEDACRTDRACCVGSTDVGSCCAPTPSVVAIDPSACILGPPSSCGAIDARVVSGSPRIGIDGALVPVAGVGVDGAVDFPSITLQPRGESITLRARIGSPETTAQLDATAFGLWSPTLPTTHVSPLIAVVVSATRDDVSVVSGQRVLATTTRTAGVVDYTIELAPTGVVTVNAGGTTLGPVTISLPQGELVPVVFGRVANDDDGTTTRLRSLAIERRACDVPSALLRAGGLTPMPGAGLVLSDPSDPSVLERTGAPPLVAFTATSGVSNDTRAIFLADLSGTALTDVRSLLDVVGLEAALEEPVDVVSLSSPHLFATTVDGASTAGAYFAYETLTDGVRAWQIARIASVSAATPEVQSIDLGGSFDDPALLPDGRLLVRERTSDGGTGRFVLFDLTAESPALESDLCSGRDGCEATRTDAFVLEPSSDPYAFDHDEVAAPFALHHGGVTRIYYAGRRGTRWSVGVLLQSADGGFFRPANDANAVLGPSGAGSDSLGALAPTVFVEDGELVLLYVGSDGVRTSLLSARMPIR